MILQLVIRSLLVLLLFGHSLWLMAQGHWLLGFVENTGIVAFLLWGTLAPNSRFFGPIQSSLTKDLALTIDDGPDPNDTPVLLNILDEFGVKATFFLIGQKAQQHPELVREIRDRGHQIGNHTWSHPQASFWASGPLRTYREIARCQKCLTEITGQEPILFRAPVGHSTFFVHPVLKAFGLRLIGWNRRGYDAGGLSADEVLKNIRAGLQEGSLILAHEATPIAEHVIRGILEEARKRGYSFVATIK